MTWKLRQQTLLYLLIKKSTDRPAGQVRRPEWPCSIDGSKSQLDSLRHLRDQQEQDSKLNL